MKKIKVLIVDDSALVRRALTDILSSDPALEVIATAADPIFAAKKIVADPPDVITLDLEMPRMNGLTFLKKLMAQFPVPVVIISSLTLNGAKLSLDALNFGAVDVITKPKLTTKEFFEESRIRICNSVRGAAVTRMRRRNSITVFPDISPKLSADSILAPTSNVHIKETTDKVIALGASTGGTTAIQQFLEGMPPDCPGIVIVQHMPELFTKSFANRLNSICEIKVKEGENGDAVTRGKAIIAPGNKHIVIKKSGAKYYVEVIDGPLVNRHRPSVDVLFRSAAQNAGKNAIGIIMTGMGDDGAKGLLEMKQAGAFTVAQDKQSCVVFGMPKVAIDLGAADKIVSLDNMAAYISQKFR